MIALIQRVREASVNIEGETVAAIAQGLLVLLGVQKGDQRQQAEKLAERVVNYRVFEDGAGKMNLSVKEIGGQILVVSQFTLVADTNKGRRPSFSSAAEPSLGKSLYQVFLDSTRTLMGEVQSGRFGADMQVSLINDGPVTFLLQE